MSRMNRVIFNLLFWSSGLYLVNVFSVSPIYIVFIFCFFMFIIYNYKYISFPRDRLTLDILFLIVYVLISQIRFRNYVLTFIFLFQFFYFFLIRMVILKIDINYINKFSLRKFIQLNKVLLLMECITRLVYPYVHNFLLDDYYNFKKYSIMYPDSNYVASYIICILGFLSYVYCEKKQYMFDVFNVLTLCKASVLTRVIIFFYRKINKYLKILILLILTIGIYKLLGNTWTWKSKFLIIDSVVDYIKNSATLCDFLFGIGLGNTVNKIGIGPHIIFVGIFFELGLFGGILFLLIWLDIYKYSNKKASFVILPMLISGVSFIPQYIPYFYVFCALIIRNEKNIINKKEEINEI